MQEWQTASCYDWYAHPFRVHSRPTFVVVYPIAGSCWGGVEIVTLINLKNQHQSAFGSRLDTREVFIGYRNNAVNTAIYSVSQKIPAPMFSYIFFPNGWEFLVQILHTYYAFLSTLNYKPLSNYLQFWRSYATLSAATQFTSYAHNARWHFPIDFLTFSPKQLGITPITCSYLR